MDINTQNLIKERMDSLPPEFKAALATIDWAKIVQEIGQKNNIHVDKIGDLQTETMLVLMGVTHPGDFQTEIERALQLPEDSGAGILNDINEKILLPLRKKVMEATGEKEEVEAKSSEAGSPDASEEASREDKATIETLRRIDRMPPEVHKLIGDTTLPAKISGVGKSANMSDQELSDLEDIISMVFLGYIHPDRLGVEVKAKFNYPDSKVALIADGVNKEIFAPIRGALIKNYEESLEKAVSSGEVLKMAGVEVLGTEEGVRPPKLDPGVGPLGAMATPTNIAAQKLSATFRMPKQETDLSLVKTQIPFPSSTASGSPTPAPAANSTSSPQATPKIDPYKEKI